MKAPGFACLAMLVAVGCAACDTGTAPPGPTPSASATPAAVAAGPIAVPTLLQPPPGPISTVDTSPAAQALAAAGRLTADAASMRMKLAARVGAAGSGRHLDVTATGEAESKARSTLRAVIDLSGRRLATEAAVYDGKSYARTEGEAWRPAKPGGPQANPQGYSNFVAGASSVVDGGPGVRKGVATEQYRATATTPGATPVKLVAWVEVAGGHLIGLDMVFPDIGAGEGSMTIDFSDIGADIRVLPPVLTP